MKMIHVFVYENCTFDALYCFIEVLMNYCPVLMGVVHLFFIRVH